MIHSTIIFIHQHINIWSSTYTMANMVFYIGKNMNVIYNIFPQLYDRWIRTFIKILYWPKIANINRSTHSVNRNKFVYAREIYLLWEFGVREKYCKCRNLDCNDKLRAFELQSRILVNNLWRIMCRLIFVLVLH